MIFGKIL